MQPPLLLAASAVAVVWLTVGLVSIVAVAAMVIGLVRHGILIGRTVSRFQDEMGPITEEISRLSAANARIAASMGRRRPGRQAS
jgi:hypothetical protein